MTVSVAQKRKDFFKLHESGCFVLPNPFDVGSARLLASLGYKALASTSAGFAWTMGRSDYGLKLDELLEHLTELSAATDLPVNADFESGFADEPAGVAENVRKAAATGVAGLSVENRTTDPKNPLYDFELSVERIRAARAALDDDESGVLLVARCEGFLTGEANLDMTIKRLVAFAEAGADCLYAPGIRTAEQISAVVKAVAPKPVNVLVMSPDFRVAELAELGVRRVSLGGQLAAAAWGGFMRAAKEIAEQGTFSELKNSYSGRDITKVFAQYAAK
jgi:2-methylisocitrate lyase-like PEP mutase family enzyme